MADKEATYILCMHLTTAEENGEQVVAILEACLIAAASIGGSQLRVSVLYADVDVDVDVMR